MFWLYTLMIHLAFLLLLPVLLLHPKLREGFWARLGFVPAGWPGLVGAPRVWFHGASAGDLLALQPVIAELRGRLPGCAVLVTTVTNSGMAVARKGLVAADAIGYLPYDLPWAVRRVMRRARPDLLVLEYAEIWPALIRGASFAGAKLMLTNGRFHERGLLRYRLLYRLIGNPLLKLDLLCMRDEAERKHALAIGAPAARVRVTGNTKFDRVACGAPVAAGDDPELTHALGVRAGDRLWVAGSTHEGEEGPLLDCFCALRASHPELRLVLAPRYVERAGKLQALVLERGLEGGLRSAGVGHRPVAILDTVGELSQIYRLASVVFVGGSFIRRGGQNILEPAACGKPVLFGPHMDNFADSVRVLVGRGGIQVPDAQRLQRTLEELLANPAELDKLGQLARASVRSLQGASRANVDAILDLLTQAGRERAL
jgi:3-deoxy-D-manno-octulosonic-acid transferase